MKPDRTSLDLAFPHPIYGTFTPVKLHLEYPLAPGETEEDAWDAGKKRMEEWFASRYPDPNQRSAPSIQEVGYVAPQSVLTTTPNREETVIKVVKETPKNRIEALVADINSCTEIKVLESYKLMVKKDDTLQAAYDNKLKSLQK